MNKRISVGERVFYIANYIFLTLCAFVAIFPFFNVISLSLSSSRAIVSGEVYLLPVEFNFGAYQNLIEDGQLLVAMKNTVIITVVGTLINMVGTIMVAYPLAKRTLIGRKPIMSLIVFTMLFSGGMIPNFILVKTLGLMDTYWALWLPGIVSVYNMIIMKSFFENIPDSLIEAAQIDGANDIYVLVRIVLPLSLPVLATLTLFYAVGWWNNYFNVMIYINSSEKLSLPVKLMQMINNFNDTLLQSGEGAGLQEDMVPEAVKSAAIVITAIPIMCVFPFLQKYFVKGVMIGSVKG